MVASPPKRARAALRSAAALVLITITTLAVAELPLRLLDPRDLRQEAGERSLSYGYDAELGWAPIPNSDSTVMTARRIRVAHNSLGFRDIEFRPDGRPVMLFIGDSFVWGVDAEANERFTDLLRDRLPQFAIVNAGVSGYGTDQEYLWLQRIWARIHPEIVVLVFCTDNDRKDNTTNVRYNRYRKPYFDTDANGALTVKGQPVPKGLQLAIRDSWLVKNLWLARIAALAYVESSAPEISVPDPTERLVSRIDGYASAKGAKLLVALQSADDRLISHLNAEHIPFVSLDGAPAYSIQFGAHFTPEGHQFASRRIEELARDVLHTDQDSSHAPSQPLPRIR